MSTTCIHPVKKHHIQALRDTMDVVSGKWKLVILATLLGHKYRFRELSREIGITPRVLAKELQELEHEPPGEADRLRHAPHYGRVRSY